MGRIFVFAGHGEQEYDSMGTGTVVAGITQVQEMIQLRDLIVSELRSRQSEVLSVPDDLSLAQAIDWINTHARLEDIAVEIHADAFANPWVRGTSVVYIANNSQRKQNAELLLLALLRRVPQLLNRGTKPDTAIGVGTLGFCRQVMLPSLLLEVGFLTNPDDRFLIQQRRREIATGIADGLLAWSQAILPTAASSSPFAPHTPHLTPPPCNINLNGQTYGEQGIVVSGNACIPVDLADRIGIDLSTHPEVRRISYRNVVYLRAIDLREFYLSVSWNSANQTVSLRSALSLCPGQIDRIASHGNMTEVQLMMFLKMNNETGLSQFPELAKFYREEGGIEGINYDIAFSQMCVETNFLRFGRDSQPEQNNFGNLGSLAGGTEEASFPNARLGVRAQIQHLKAYANIEPLVQEIVDPRFQFVTRGIAPFTGQLSGRWSADMQYGNRIMAVLKRLYETSGLL